MWKQWFDDVLVRGLEEAKYWTRSHLDADAALLQGEGDEGIMVRARTLYFISLLSLVCKSAGFIKSQSLFSSRASLL